MADIKLKPLLIIFFPHVLGRYYYEERGDDQLAVSYLESACSSGSAPQMGPDND